MRTVGVIAEYNPFHNGHAYHLQKAKDLSGADKVVVVMSSCFVQRGEPALLSPSDRARMALSCGADAVFSLPACWAVRDAEHFALGGVALLKGLGVDAISFGAETADLPLLRACASLLEYPTPVYEAALKDALGRGLPYPTAMEYAAQTALPGASEALASPNNTLAICYLRAIMKLGAQMDVFPVARRADYHATGLGDSFPSATALRAAILRGDWAGSRNAMPPAAYEVLLKAAREGRMHRPESLDLLLLHRLRSMAATSWHKLPDLSEGIEDRLRPCALQASTRQELLAQAKTRRYPYARLSRLCTHALLGMKAENLRAEPLPTAAWLLGLKNDAAEIFSAAKKNGFPIIGKAAAYQTNEAWLQTEHEAYELWALGCGLPSGMARTQGVVRL